MSENQSQELLICIGNSINTELASDAALQRARQKE